MDDSAVVINTDRCIGCGVCTTACEFESISLKPKDEMDKVHVWGLKSPFFSDTVVGFMDLHEFIIGKFYKFFRESFRCNFIGVIF